MADHVVTLYEIRNAPNLALDYRLVDIEGFLGAGHGDHDLVDRNLNLLAKQVAIKERSPVAIVRRGDARVLAIPADRTLQQLEYSLAPTLVRLKPESQTHTLQLNDGQHRHIAQKFIEFSLRGPLDRHHELWASSSRTFLQKRPVNFRDTDRTADLYEGFHFHLRFLDDRLFLGVALSYKYTDSAWLVDCFGVDEMRGLKMRHILYHYGNRWYIVQILDVLNCPIRDARFEIDGAGEPTNVYDYTIADQGNTPPPWIQSLDPMSPAITYRAPGRDQVRFAAAALGKLVYKTDAAEVRFLHRRSIKSPADRFAFTKTIVERYFSKATYGGIDLGVSTTAHTVAPKTFAVPTLLFGQRQTLRISGQEAEDAVRLADLPSARMNRLLDSAAGFAVTSPLDAQYVLVPQTLSREIATDFRNALESTVRGFIHAPYRLEAVLYDDRNARTLKQQVESIVNALATARVSHGHGVLILPENAKPDLHNYVKSRLKETIQVQCVSARKVEEFYQSVLRAGHGQVEVRPDLRGRYSSYLRYAALGLLIVNRQWGWVLKDGTYYDAYISFDVLNNHAAFGFFYEGGRKCFVRTFPSKQKEKLLRAQVRTIAYDGLRQDLDRGLNIRSLVLQRDGRLFDSEWLGFSDAITALIQEKRLPEDLVFGAIEVHKTSSNMVRIAKVGIDGVRNPRIGVALELATDEGIVCNTGYPFRLNGSVNPVLVRVAKGPLDLSKILEDTFRKSLLAWPVPDRMIRLPIDLKLCDEFLRAAAADADEDEATYGGEQDNLIDAVNAT